MSDYLDSLGVGDFIEYHDDTGMNEVLSRFFGCKFLLGNFTRMYPDSESVEHYSLSVEPIEGCTDSATENAIALFNLSYMDRTFERPDMAITAFIDCLIESRELRVMVFDDWLKSGDW